METNVCYSRGGNIWFYVAKDIDAASEVMSNAGVRVSEIKMYGNGQRAFGIAAPEGNVIDIIQYKQGNVNGKFD